MLSGLFQLSEVHCIRRFRSGRDVGDLALIADIADGNRVRPVGVGIRAERDAILRVRVGQEADRRGVQRRGVAAAAQRTCAVRVGRREGTQCGCLHARRFCEGAGGGGSEPRGDRAVAQRGRCHAGGFGCLQDQPGEPDDQVAVIGDAANRQAVVPAGVAAIPDRGAVGPGDAAEGPQGGRIVAVDQAAVAHRGRLQAVGNGTRAAREAEGPHGLRPRAERGGADLAGRRGRVEKDLAGDRILVVQPATDRGAGVAVGDGAVAGRVGVDAPRDRAAAEGGGTIPVG